jgi:hypothetical protein
MFAGRIRTTHGWSRVAHISDTGNTVWRLYANNRWMIKRSRILLQTFVTYLKFAGYTRTTNGWSNVAHISEPSQLTVCRSYATNQWMIKRSLILTWFVKRSPFQIVDSVWMSHVLWHELPEGILCQFSRLLAYLWLSLRVNRFTTYRKV